MRMSLSRRNFFNRSFGLAAGGVLFERFFHGASGFGRGAARPPIEGTRALGSRHHRENAPSARPAGTGTC